MEAVNTTEVERTFAEWHRRRAALQAHSMLLDDALYLFKDQRGPVPTQLIDKIHLLRLECDLLLQDFFKAVRQQRGAVAGSADEEPPVGRSGRGAASVMAYMRSQTEVRGSVLPQAAEHAGAGASSATETPGAVATSVLQQALEDWANALDQERTLWSLANSRLPNSALFDAELAADYERAVARAEVARKNVERLRGGRAA